MATTGRASPHTTSEDVIDDLRESNRILQLGNAKLEEEINDLFQELDELEVTPGAIRRD